MSQVSQHTIEAEKCTLLIPIRVCDFTYESPKPKLVEVNAGVSRLPLRISLYGRFVGHLNTDSPYISENRQERARQSE